MTARMMLARLLPAVTIHFRRGGQTTFAMKNKFSGALLILLDEAAQPRPTLVLHLQDLIRRLIADGVVAENERLPSTRALAKDLGISRDTVEAAYQQLDAEGYITRKTGSGTFAAKLEHISIVRQPVQRGTIEAAPDADLPAMSLAARGTDISVAGGVVDQTDVHPFVAAMPDIESFPIETWHRLTSHVIRRSGRKLLMYGNAQGYEPLRQEIWRYLAAHRGVRCEPDQILVLTSSQQALNLIGTILVDPCDIIAVENPGYHGAKLAFLAVGSFLKPVGVDADGIVVSEIADSRAPVRAVYVTPSHQYPTGATLSLDRRLALLDWAEKTGSWIVEDDYDSEYRYDGQPLAAIQGRDNGGHVLYVGTFNKILFPSLRLAYLVLPKQLVKAFVAARTLLDGQSQLLAQAVLCEFMREGHFTAHIRRMRELYRGRRNLFVSALFRYLSPYVEANVPAGGLSIACYLKDNLVERRTVEIAKSVGIELPTLRRLYLGGQGRQGWLLGFAALEPDIAARAMKKLSSSLAKEFK
jgi:GntR family transcriptional regulator/MocR family aminotransferase